MNKIAEQLRTNAKAIMVPHAKDGMPEAAIAGALEMAADEIDRLEEEEIHLMRARHQEHKKVRAIVNMIRGENPEVMWSTHDVVELVAKAMEVVHAARPVLKIADLDTDEFNRLRDALDAMPHPERVCEDCGGSGDVMVMECYGGPPCEVQKKCEPCKGSGFIVDPRPLTDPSVPLPLWDDLWRKSERGESLNPIESFVLRFTPGNNPEMGRDFRRLLRAALDSVPKLPKVDER